MPDMTFRSVVPNRLPFTADPNDPALIQLCRRILHTCTAAWITGATGATARALTLPEVDSLANYTEQDEVEGRLPGSQAGDDVFDHGVTLYDMQTAAAVAQVYDNLSAENQQRYMTLHPVRIGRAAWEILGRLSQERKAAAR